MPTLSLKEQGNERFKAAEYKDAEDLYTQAIHNHPTEATIFNNRALTRIRLQDWRNAESDARKAIELFGPENKAAMKSYYYLGQSLVALRHTTEAMTAAQKAYKWCLETKDKSADIMSQFILRTKQAHWQTRETTRLRELNQTLGVVETLLEEQLERDLQDIEDRFSNGELGLTGRVEEKELLQYEADERRRIIREAFSDSKIPETMERIVPDYMIDAITFEIMHDPVITPSGQSYERVGLLKHIANTGNDPLTREPLTEKQVISNHALKTACSEFLEANGWAVDW